MAVTDAVTVGHPRTRDVRDYSRERCESSEFFETLAVTFETLAVTGVGGYTR